MFRNITVILISVSLYSVAWADDAATITYDDHVAAIFKRHCVACHGETKQKAGLDLSNFAGVIKGGSGGTVVQAGRSNASRIIEAITAEDAAERMPPDNDPLPTEQVALMKAWIDGGLRQNSKSAGTAARSVAFTPSLMSQLRGPAPLPTELPSYQKTKTSRPFPVLALAASPTAPVIAVASYEAIDFLDPATSKNFGSIPFPVGEPHVLKFNRTGSILLAAGGRPVQSGVAALFEVKTGKQLAELGNESDVILAADLSTDERRVAIGGSSRVVKILSTEDGSQLHTLVKHTDWITSIAFSPDGKLLATGDRIGNIHLWDAAGGGVLLALSEHKGSIRSLTWRSDSRILASCGEDGLIVLWDVEKGFPLTSKAGSHSPLRPEGAYGKIAGGVLDGSFGLAGELVTSGRDRTVKLWSADGQLLKTYPIEIDSAAPNQSLPLRVVLTFDGKTITAGDSGGKLHTWSVEKSK